MCTKIKHASALSSTYVHDQYVCILYKGKSIGQCRGDFCWGLWHVVALETLVTDTWLGTVSILTNPLTPRGPLTKLNKTQDDQSKLNQLIYTDPPDTISDDQPKSTPRPFNSLTKIILTHLFLSSLDQNNPCILRDLGNTL